MCTLSTHVMTLHDLEAYLWATGLVVVKIEVDDVPHFLPTPIHKPAAARPSHDRPNQCCLELQSTLQNLANHRPSCNLTWQRPAAPVVAVEGYGPAKERLEAR